MMAANGCIGKIVHSEPKIWGQVLIIASGYLYCAEILSIVRNRCWRLLEIIVDDTSENILPSTQTFCTPLRARHRKVLADALVWV